MNYYKEIQQNYNLVKKYYDELENEIFPLLINKIDESKDADFKEKEFKDFLSEISYNEILKDANSVINNKVYKILDKGDINKQIKALEAEKEKYYVRGPNCPYNTDELELIDYNGDIPGECVVYPVLSQTMNNIIAIHKRDKIKEQKETFKKLRKVQNKKDANIKHDHVSIYKVKDEVIDKKIKSLKITALVCDENTLKDILDIINTSCSQLVNTKKELENYIVKLDNKEFDIDDIDEDAEEYKAIKEIAYNLKK